MSLLSAMSASSVLHEEQEPTIKNYPLAHSSPNKIDGEKVEWPFSEDEWEMPQKENTSYREMVVQSDIEDAFEKHRCSREKNLLKCDIDDENPDDKEENDDIKKVCNVRICSYEDPEDCWSTYKCYICEKTGCLC